MKPLLYKLLERVLEEELLDMYSNHSSQDNESKEEAATGGYEPQQRSQGKILMSKLVQKRFSIVATSVPSERLFSLARNVINNRPSSLLPENADKLICLFENSDY